MPLHKSVAILLSEAILMSLELKLQQCSNSPSIIADMTKVEDTLAVHFHHKTNTRQAWVGEARLGEGILIFLAAEDQRLSSDGILSNFLTYRLDKTVTRHIVKIDEYSQAVDIVLNYLLRDILP